MFLTFSQFERCFVKSFGWYETSEMLCISMEYFELGDLKNCLRSIKDMIPEDQVREITFQLLEGLSYMHDNGFAHRDLKLQVCSSAFFLSLLSN
jgi:serine/threonine protein kinase